MVSDPGTDWTVEVVVRYAQLLSLILMSFNKCFLMFFNVRPIALEDPDIPLLS